MLTLINLDFPLKWNCTWSDSPYKWRGAPAMWLLFTFHLNTPNSSYHYLQMDYCSLKKKPSLCTVVPYSHISPGLGVIFDSENGVHLAESVKMPLQVCYAVSMFNCLWHWMVASFMTYLNNEKHETFLTHAIFQGGDFYDYYGRLHGDGRAAAAVSDQIHKRLSGSNQAVLWSHCLNPEARMRKKLQEKSEAGMRTP